MLDSVTKEIRCAIYTRKSSDEGLEQEFNSLDAQRESCEAYIKSQQHEGWIALPTLYDDGGISGGTINRPALQQLLKDIKAGLVDTIVVYKIDRLTRSLMDFAKIVEILDGNNASFVSVTQQFNTTTSMGRLTLNVLLSFAQFEREVTAERIRDKVAQSKAKGMWTGGCVPLGYDAIDKKLVINPTEAETVRLIFDRYLALGCVQRLQADLEAHGAQSKRRVDKNGKVTGGGGFSRSALYQILKNRIYAGDIAHHDKVYTAQHKAIISKEQWTKVQELLSSGAVPKKHNNYAKSPAPLAGLVYDDKGNRLTSTHSNKSNLRYRYYISQAVLQFRGDQAGVVTRIPAKSLEIAVIDDIKRLLSDQFSLMEDICSPHDSPEEIKLILQNANCVADSLEKAEPSELKESLSRLICRVDITTDTIITKLTRNGLRNLLIGHATENQISLLKSTQSQADEIVRRISIAIQKTGRGTKLIVEPSIARPQVNDPLIKAVVRSHNWLKQLLNGEVASVQEIADRENLPHRYTARILRLAFLAPDLVEEILGGHQSPDVTVEALMDSMPLGWPLQRSSLRPTALKSASKN